MPEELFLYTYRYFKKCPLINIKNKDITKKMVLQINNKTDFTVLRNVGSLCFASVGKK